MSGQAAKTLGQLYREMLRIRMVEEEIAKRYPEQQMRCPVHLCIGQEAIAVGVSAALQKQDSVVGTHRSHGHYLAKGGDLGAMIAEIYGKATGCAKGKGGSMHLIDLEAGFLGSVPILGATIAVGVGIAFATALRKESSVTCIFFGDAAAEEGTLHESLNFALLKKLPVIFVCENNCLSTCSPLAVRQPPHRAIGDIAQGHGMKAYLEDGNDVEIVYRIAQEAVDRARSGGGPSFLELKTCRLREHCGPLIDDALGYRTDEEREARDSGCPIEKLGTKLMKSSLASREALDGVACELTAEIEAAFASALSAPFPDLSQLFSDVYAS